MRRGMEWPKFATMLEFRRLSLADPLIGIRFHPSISGSALRFVRRCQRIAAVGATARAVLERHERSRDPIVPPTRQPLVAQVEMEDLPRANRAQEKPLPVAAVVARVAHDIDRLELAVDEHGDRRLAREGRERQAGAPNRIRNFSRPPIQAGGG